MPSWLLPLVFLACPVGMGLIMFFMMRGQHQGKMADHRDAMSPEARLARLEAEKRALEQQIAATDRGKMEAGAR